MKLAASLGGGGDSAFGAVGLLANRVMVDAELLALDDNRNPTLSAGLGLGDANVGGARERILREGFAS